MAVTVNKDHKFAFLLAGAAGTLGSRYEKDVEMVFQTLTEYYNYPLSQIWVVFGQTPTSTAAYAGANIVTLTSLTDLNNAFDAFNDVAKVSADHTMLLYFTGVGNSEEVELTGIGEVLDVPWLEEKASDIDNGQVNVIMQQSYAESFQDTLALTSSGDWSFTAACNDSEESYGDADGSYFTKGWIRGLQFEQLSTNEFADELNPLGADLQISLNQAMKFAEQELTINSGADPISTPVYNDIGGPYYLGKPLFLIRDGDQQAVPRSWWESPDIFITNSEYPAAADNDWYVTGETNTVHVRVKNTGTHPVRKFWLGAKNFGSGIGATDFIYLEELSTNSLDLSTQLSGVIKADEEYEHTYGIDFSTAANHRCIKARAQLLEIPANELDEYSDWSIQIEDDEAQRNIDLFVAPLPPIPPAPDEEPEEEPEPPEPDEGAIPDTDTEAEAAPEMEDAIDAETEETEIPPEEEPTPMEERGIRNIRRYREHIYEIKNHFKQKQRFLLVFPKEYYKYKELFRMEWFERPAGIGKQLMPLKIEEKPFLHIPFNLEPGETRRILSYLALRKNVEIGDKRIDLPFEILVDKIKTRREIKKRRLAIISDFRPEYSPVAGLTLSIKQGEAELRGTLIDKGGKPVSNAWIFLHTANKRQGAILRTRKNGSFKAERINPDVYSIMVVAKDWFVKEKMYLLKDGKNNLKLSTENAISGKPFKVILDKVRILDDKDPLFFGKGEFAFTAVVVADGNEKTRHVHRLPDKGIFEKSDRTGKNEIDLGVTIFDGSAQKSLSIGISGKEFDFLTPDDNLKRYLRVLTGNPNNWYGKYSPRDEYSDKERVGDWEVWYRIVRV